MVTDLLEERRGILKYILYHYAIDNKETVWVLNYLKDHPHLGYCRFTTPHLLQKGITLTDRFRLLFKYDDMIVTEADVIFNLLNEIDEPFYFYTTFTDRKITDFREYEWLVDQINQQTVPEEIDLNNRLIIQLREMVESRIDLALLMNGREDFQYYSTLLNKLKE
ncbi:YpiB family protein [Macrococcus carouselicus]|uniref:Uncharacterized protein n=1 Tax=Macrococcus carouselicus TaxID=69969 RepID=A0A9Q8CP11_9STAP|nr:YpiB family protein [Macrococcus carouselicus]TDM04269.1 hypothetical protein ERX40_03625 [Macrococcus carouselicus]